MEGDTQALLPTLSLALHQLVFGDLRCGYNEPIFPDGLKAECVREDALGCKEQRQACIRFNQEGMLLVTGIQLFFLFRSIGSTFFHVS